MKKVFILFAICISFISIYSQIPEKISYQAVVRDVNNSLVANQVVGIQISILESSFEGQSVYTETQSPTTNDNGLITIEIGTGNTTDDFSLIDWSNSSFFIKTEMDISGGNNYTIIGTSQLLSVPYALHAKTATKLTEDIVISESQISDLKNYLVEEVDPIFESWDKTTGIVISESQISDLKSYITEEIDPVFSNSIASQITADDTSKWNKIDAVTEESDPKFNAWDKSTGISLTESQIIDFKEYLTQEADPVFTAWDKTVGIVISESQISDLKAYLTAEVDPLFGAWDKSTGIVINESQVSDLQSYLKIENDPLFISWDKDYNDLTNKPVTITTGQAEAIKINSTKKTYPANDSIKLANIEIGAQVNVQADWDANSGDAQILNKPTTINTTQSNAILTNTAHSGAMSGNPHNVTKDDIGLTNVDNTSDSNKPISIATQSALDNKVDVNNVLALDNVAEFIPDSDYEPTTKRYVDALISRIEILEDNLIASGNYQLRDVVGNEYNVVKVGNQVWMSENLSTTKFANGDDIETTDPYNMNIAGISDPIYQWAYNGNESNATTYGRLYTWYTISDSRNICPDGWHVASDEDWAILENYLADNGYNYDGSIGGGRAKIAKSMATDYGWTSFSDAGVVGNTDYPTYRNKSSFSALPGGYRLNDGTFNVMGNDGFFWTSSENSSSDAISRKINFTRTHVIRETNNKKHAFYVRCLRD